MITARQHWCARQNVGWPGQNQIKVDKQTVHQGSCYSRIQKLFGWDLRTQTDPAAQAESEISSNFRGWWQKRTNNSQLPLCFILCQSKTVRERT